jgi:class 3 adenylate cyclase
MGVPMRERVLELMACWRKRGFALGLGMRIAHGYATIGAIGFGVALGLWCHRHGAQSGARLWGEAAPGQILISRRRLGLL